MSSKKLLIFGMILASLSFFACENGNSTKSDEQQPRILAETPENVAISETKNIAAMAINFSKTAVSDFLELKAKEDGLAKVTIPGYTFDYNTMWHTWNVPILGENLSGYRLRAQQFLNTKGVATARVSRASGALLYYITEGKYGFPDGSPLGTTWKHTVGSAESPLYGMLIGNSYLISGTATYHKTWTGYYSATGQEADYELVTIDNSVEINLGELTVSLNGDGTKTLSMVGTIDFAFADWSATLTCNGGDVITGVLKNQGFPVTTLAYPLADLLAMAENLLPY